MALSDKDFNKLVSGIMNFVATLGGMPPYSYQYVFARRIVESVIKNDGHTITGLWSRQAGKTTTVASVGIGLAVILPVLANQFDGGKNPDGTERALIEELQPFKNGFWVGIFAPITRQALLSYTKMRKILYSKTGQEILSDPEIDVSLTMSRGDSLTLSIGSYVHSKTASPDANIEGETYHLIICLGEETKIITPTGERLIGDLVKTKYRGQVLGWDHNQNAFVWADVKEHQKFTAQVVFELKFDNGTTVIATGDHLWWTEDGGYVSTAAMYKSIHAGYDVRRFILKSSSQRVYSSSTSCESWSTAEGIRGMQSREIERNGAESQSRYSTQSGLWNNVGSSCYQLFSNSLNLLQYFLPSRNKTNKFSHNGESKLRRFGVVVDGRWFRRAKEKCADACHTWIYRFRSLFVRGMVSPAWACALSSSGLPWKRNCFAFSDTRFCSHDRTHAPVRSSNDGIQVCRVTQTSVCNLSQEVRHLSETGQSTYLFPNLSKKESKYTNHVQKQIRLVSIERREKETVVYDLTTATGNFFANGVLSHNCDESQKLDRFKVEKEIEPMLSSTNGCLTGDSLVWMADGTRRRIEDLFREKPENAEVWSVEDEELNSWKLVPRKIEAYHNNGIKECVRISLRGGREIEVTENHHFVRLHNINRNKWAWKRADELQVGDRVAVPWQEVDAGKDIEGPLPELLGYLISEGCLTDCSVEVAVTLPELIADLEQLTAAYGPDVKWSHSGRKGRITAIRRGTRKLNRLQQELQRLGLWGASAHTKRIPAECFGWSNATIERLLSRLFAGDGCAHFGKVSVIKYTTINRGLADDVMSLLDRIGVYSTIQPHIYEVNGEARVAWDVTISDVESQRRFFVSVKWMKPVNDLPAFKKFLHETSGKLKQMPVRFECIDRVEYIGPRQTYDLQVAVSHNYIANGIVSHNTMVKIGTAWVSRGGFQADIQWNIEQYRRRLAPRNHFEFPYEIIIAEKEEAFKRDGNKFHLNYKKHVEHYIRRKGRNSLAFRMNYRLEWQDSNLNAFSAAAILDAQDASRSLNVYVPSTLIRVAGIDVGKDNDPTVVTINEVDFNHPIIYKDPVSGEVHEYYKKMFIAIREFEGQFEDGRGMRGQYSNVMEFLREWDTTRACIDSTSIGNPVAERMQKLTPEIEWDFYVFSAPSKDKLYRNYIDEIESGRQKIAVDAKAKETTEFLNWEEQHRQLEKHFTQNGYMVCRAPEPQSKTARDAETESEYHDDYPDSSALAAWAARTAHLAEAETVAATGTGGYSSSSHQRYGGRSTVRARYGRRH